MNALVPLQFENRPIRVIMLDDAPWWLASDVCTILGLDNPTRALSRLDDDERKLLKNNSLTIKEGVINQQLNENQLVNIINESGVYSLIFTSRKPEAKAFKRWVTHEVLPTIRKTGMYGVSPDAIRAIVHEELARLAIRTTLEIPITQNQQKEPNLHDQLRTYIANHPEGFFVPEARQKLGLHESPIAVGKALAKLGCLTKPKHHPVTRRTTRYAYPPKSIH